MTINIRILLFRIRDTCRINIFYTRYLIHLDDVLKSAPIISIIIF